MDKKTNADLTKVFMATLFIILILLSIILYTAKPLPHKQTEKPSPIIEVSEWCLQKCANETNWIYTKACLNAWCGIEVSS